MHSGRASGLVIASVIVILSRGCSFEAAAQTYTDTLWQQVDPNPSRWIRHRGVKPLLKRLTIQMGDVPTFSITIPCGENERETTLIWKGQDVLGRGIGCKGQPLRPKASDFREKFEPLPKEVREVLVEMERRTKPKTKKYTKPKKRWFEYAPNNAYDMDRVA
jgi:hypothetical protein